MVQWPIAPPPQQSLSLPDLVDSGYLFIILVNFDMAVEMQSAFGLQIWGVVDRHLPPVPKEDGCHTLTDMAIFRPRTDIYARRSLLDVQHFQGSLSPRNVYVSPSLAHVLFHSQDSLGRI